MSRSAHCEYFRLRILNGGVTGRLQPAVAIDEWHRILKSGCRIEARQHQTAERLQRAIVMDVVPAWRIHLLTLLGREVPELPCEVLFDDWEVKVLEALRAER